MKLHLRTIGMFLLALGLCLLMVLVMVINRNSVERLTMEQLITEKSARINDVMLRLLLRTESISTYIQHHGGETADISWLAEMLLDDPAIANIIVAPDGVVSYVYPLYGNEVLLGMDLFSQDAVLYGDATYEARPLAHVARETRQLMLGGPFTAAQGGEILVSRLPVFLNGGDFWGIIGITLHHPGALYGAGLAELSAMGFDYEIWRHNPMIDGMQLIASSYETREFQSANFVEVPISIVNADWYFRILAVRAWYTFPETWLSIIGSVFIGLLVAALVHNYQHLKKLRDLHSRNEMEKHMMTTKLLVSSLEQQDNITRQHRKEAALFRHDLRHIGSMTLFCMDNGDQAGARKLIKDMDVRIREIESAGAIREMTGHSIIDAALCHCIDVAVSLGIETDVQMQRVSTEKDTTELAVVLANSFENAINACKEIPEGRKRAISVTGKHHGNQYFIETANTCKDEVLLDPVSGLPQRGSGKGHGIGTQSILYFAQKHSAILGYEYKDNWLHMRLLI